MSLLYPVSPRSLLPSLQCVGTTTASSSRHKILGTADAASAAVLLRNHNVGNAHQNEEYIDDSFKNLQLEPFLSLFNYFECNQTNPMTLLVEFYQKKKKNLSQSSSSLENPSAWFHDQQVQFPGPSSGDQVTYWHSTFQCPLSSNLQTASCLPLPLYAHELGMIQEGLDEKAKLKSLILATQKFFGSAYTVSSSLSSSQNGLVYWRQKKAARKSCALAALLQLAPAPLPLVMDDDDRRQFYMPQQQQQPKMDNTQPAVFAWEIGHARSLLTTTTNDTTKPAAADLHSACITTPAAEVAEASSGTRGIVSSCCSKTYPSWVNQLYGLGLQSVSISYYQSSSSCPDESSSSSSDDDEWKLTPCPIYCRIDIHQPIKLTVKGSPHLSKTNARQSAIEELEVLLSSSSRSSCSSSFAISPHHTPEKLVKEGILKSNAKTIHIRTHHPSWATSSFLHVVDSQHDSFFVMYQLILVTTASGESWVKRQMMGLEDQAAHETQIGILFPRDILADGDDDDGELEFNAHFTAKERDGTECEVRVLLKNRRKISLDEDDLSAMIKFNQFLQTSRTFGFSKKSTRPTLIDLENVSAGGRTYLFVPLDSNKKIDITIIKNTLEGKIFSFQSKKWLVWNLPVIGALDSRSVSGIFFLLALVVFNFTWYELLLSTFLLIISAIALLLPIRSPQKFFTKRDLANRFLIHRKILYVTDAYGGPSNLTARCRMPDSEGTFEEYYLKRFGLELRYPNEYLIAAYRVSKHAEHDPFEKNELQPEVLFLVPELVFCFAPPRDFVYVIHQAQKFMPELERKIDIRRLAFSMCEALMDSPARAAGVNLNTLSSLLEEATSSYPTSRFERLEFLGDTVLGYFLTVEAVMMNKTFTWTADDIGDFVTKYGKNVSLVDAACCIGLQRAIYSRRAKWSSAYGNMAGQANFQSEHVEIQQSLLSDIFEGFLAAVYMTNYDIIPQILQKAFPEFLSSLKGWLPFSRKGIVAVEGGSWDLCLCRIKNAIQGNFVLNRKLQGGLEKIFLHNLDFCEMPRTQNSQIDVLICCALSNSDENLSCESEENLAQLWHVQELEFQIGNFALRFPTATPGDLMLQLTSAVCDDALSYLMTKNFFHEALIDPGIAEDFIAVANLADIEGQKMWSSNRLRSFDAKSPRYPGLLGGRLCGRNQKLPAKMTDPLVFSFKALVGALVLSCGLDNTWKCLHPVFAEILSLSAEEIRKISCDSNLSRIYTTGKKIKT